MRLIDADKFKEYIKNGVELAIFQAPLKAKKVEEMADCIIADIDAQPTVEAIPKAEYETRLKADMAAILEEIDLQFDEICFSKKGKWKTVPEIKAEYKAIIQQKINELKADQEPTTKNDLGVDCISRAQAIERLKLNFPISAGADNSKERYRYMQALADVQAIRELPPVTPQEPKIVPIAEIKYDEDKLKELVDKAVLTVTPQEPRKGHCKDCKWWKDSDGAYRRGVRAESQCPINRREVFEGNGYCYLFEPQES